jgi:hypothetical protein
MTEQIGRRVVVDEGEVAKLFYVWNTADRKLMVLAQNWATARHTAFCHDHVKDAANARVAEIDPSKVGPHEEKFFASVKAAIRDGRQGVVKNMDGFAVVGESSQTKTYAPVVEVKS